MPEYDPLLTMSALNMAIVSLHRITSSGDRLILDREYDSIINNLRMGEINDDPALKELYQEILRVINRGRLRDEVRAEIKKADSEKKHKSVKEIITGNVLKSFSTNPLKWLGKLAVSSASEYFSQQKKAEELTQNNDKEQLRLRHDELDEYDEFQRKLLGSSWSLLRQYQLPDSYRLTQKALNQFSAVMNEADPLIRHKMMKYLERDFLMYSPYWFYRAKTANESGNNDEAGKYFARFGEVWRPILRKDMYRAEAMKFRIEELMSSGINQNNAGEILKCLDEMRANTELDEWVNNIFAGMVYFALGMKEEAVDCVMCNVLFHYEEEMSNKVLERIETDKLPPIVEPLPEKLPEQPKPEPEPIVQNIQPTPKPELKVQTTPPKPKLEPKVQTTPPVSKPEPKVQTTPPVSKPEPKVQTILPTPKPKPEPKVQTTPPVSTPKRPAMSDDDFIKLCKSGDAVKVEEAIRNGADVNAMDKYGETALILAVQFGRTETAELLIKHGADVNAKSNSGMTALILAAQFGRTETAELLIKHGADVNAKNNNGWTALIWAAFDGQTETAELLLKHGADVDAKDNDSWTALMYAADDGRTDIAELLLKHGADVNAKNNDGATALRLAAWDGYTDTAELLLKHGADVNAKNNYGWTALMWAAQFGDTDTAELLLKHGADVNAKDNHGWTALIWAANKGHTDTTELLLKHGADVNAKDNYGWTALIWAKGKGKTEVAELLRSYGAKEKGLFARLFG